MGPDAMIFIFWMLSFKPTFSLSSFIKRLCSSSSLSAIRVVSSAYLRLLIFLSQQSWFQLVFLPAQCFSWCTLHISHHSAYWGFPSKLAGKESSCNARHPGSISGSGRSPGEGIGYPLQYSWVSLVAQTVKNPPVMRKTWVRSLGWENPLEEGMTTHSNILGWRIPMGRKDQRTTVHGVAKIQTWMSN